MDPAPDDIKAVLFFLKQNNSATFSVIMKKLALGYDELGTRKLKKFLLDKNLIELESEENQFGLEQWYCLTGEGDSFLLEILRAEAIDKILVFLQENRGDYTSLHISQSCKISLGVMNSYIGVLKNEGLIFSSVSKDHNGQPTYQISGTGGAYVTNTHGKLFLNQLFEDFVSKPKTAQEKSAAIEYHTNFYGETRGTIVGGISNRIEYSENKTKSIDNSKIVIDSIISIDENDTSKFNETEHQRINEAVEKFGEALLERFKLTGQGKGLISDRLDEIKELVVKENKGSFKKVGGKIFEGVAASLGKDAALSVGGYLLRSEFVTQYWQLFKNAFQDMF